MKDPIKRGTKCTLENGQVVYVIVVSRPGNGWGISYSEMSPDEYWYRSVLRLRPLQYLPWHQFRKLIVSQEEP